MKSLLLKFSYLAIFLAIGLLFIPSQSKATHIVGGEMTYECLGNDRYRIELTVYRDCFFGDALAFFDDPASIGIFNNRNEILMAVDVPFMGDDTLDAVVADPCLFVPGDVCVHTTTYETILILPPRVGGYQIVYQRCCRNQTITNIINPLQTGATFNIFITEDALETCNSSPQIQEWPPIYICLDEPINFPQDAIDKEGDSIAYKLCTPLSGATEPDPQPVPPLNPPYDPIQWKAPYGLNNILGGSPKLEIDVNTGLVTGVPQVIGQFVVGICIEEYRNGNLLSTTRRDFQYNVGECGNTRADFFAPDIQCDSLKVTFDNESQSNFVTSNIWYFGGFNNTLGTATSFDAMFTFPDTGIYEVCLVTQPLSSCADTFCKNITLQYTHLVPDFDYNLLACSDSSYLLSITDMSYDSVYAIDEWFWELSDGQTDTVQHPTFLVDQLDSLYITLLLTSTNGCTRELTDTVDPDNLIDSLFMDTLSICKGDSVHLNPNFSGALWNFNWSPGNTLDDPNLANPLAFPTESTLYTVEITDTNNLCTGRIEVFVDVFDAFDIGLPPDTALCEGTIEFGVDLDSSYIIIWSDDPDFTNVLGTTPTIIINTTEYDTLYIYAEDPDGCFNTDTVAIELADPFDVGLPADTVACDSIFELELDLGPGFNYTWSDDPDYMNILSDSSNVIFNIFDSDTIYVLVEDTLGCLSRDTIVIIDKIVDVDFSGNDLVACLGDTVCITVNNLNPDQTLTHEWEPDPDIVSPLDSVTIKVVPDEIGDHEYYVHSINEEGCESWDTVTVSILDDIGPEDIEWYQDCDSLKIYFSSTSGIANFFTWFFDYPNTDATASNGDSTCYVYDSAGIYTIALVPQDDLPCEIDTIFFEIEVYDPLIEVDFTWDAGECDSIATVEFTDLSVANQGTIVEWKWTFSDGQGSMDQNPVITFTGEDPITATLMVVTDEGCAEMLSQVLTFDLIDINPFDTLRICPDEGPVELCPGADTSYTYLWSPPDGLDDPTSPNPTADPDTTTTYCATVVGQYGICSVTKCVTVNVSPLFSLGPATADPDTINISQSSQLNVPFIPGATYVWSPDESLDDPFISNPVATPEETTIYTVTVTDEYGCVEERSVEVYVIDTPCEEPYIFIPNTFTPNNDGENDVLYVLGANIDVVFLAIYNRWGEKVFETNNKNVGWDGTYDGKELSPDVYGFYMRVRCFGGDTFFKKGNVTLMR